MKPGPCHRKLLPLEARFLGRARCERPGVPLVLTREGTTVARVTCAECRRWYEGHGWMAGGALRSTR